MKRGLGYIPPPLRKLKLYVVDFAGGKLEMISASGFTLENDNLVFFDETGKPFMAFSSKCPVISVKERT